MPCYGEDPVDWRKMEKCRKAIRAQMLADGWNEHSKKLDEVLKRKANKLYRHS